MFAEILSVISVSLACIAIGWNIYRDVVLKARVRVKFGKVHVGPFEGEFVEKLAVGAVNLGPGKVCLQTIELNSLGPVARFRKNAERAILMSDIPQPYSDTLPKWLEPGEGARIRKWKLGSIRYRILVLRSLITANKNAGQPISMAKDVSKKTMRRSHRIPWCTGPKT